MLTRPAWLALAALVAILGLWLLSQLTVATWLARQASVRAQDWSVGLSPWRWDFSDSHAVVGPGSSGLGGSRKTDNGLILALPPDGVASVSLALRGERADLAAIDQVRIELDSSAPLKIALLSVQPRREWLVAQLDSGQHRLDLAVDAPSDARAENLLLRIESTPKTLLRLQRVMLMSRACARAQSCAGRTEPAPVFLSPERLLAFRDARRATDPATSIVSGGAFGQAGQWLEQRLWGESRTLQRVLSAGLLFLLAFGLSSRLSKKRPSPSAARAAWELAATLGVALIVLLAGWPARDTPWSTGLLLALCLATLAALPVAEPRRWRWLGDHAAWKGALIFTFVAVLVTSPLALVEHEPRTSSQAIISWRYPAWALLQQWLLIAAIMPRIRQLWSDARAAALLGGLVFGLLHAPNFGLMVFTFAGGCIWAWLGQHHRAVLPLAASHAMTGMWLVYVAPHWLLRSAEIGGRYLMAP